MATVNQVLRSYGAAVRRAEREQQRRAREAAKRFKEQQKFQSIEDARQAVSDYNYYVEVLQSVHKNCTETVSWEMIRNEPKPSEPEISDTFEIVAKNKLDLFKPSFMDKMFGSSKKKIERLKKEVERAKEKDKKKNDLNFEQYKTELENWEELQEICSGVEGKDTESYKQAIEYFDPFSDIGELGSKLNISFSERFIDVDIHVNSIDIIPDYVLTQTSTGKLSKKNMPKSKFNELYQDHICSAVIRIAREVFAYLPVEYVRVNAVSNLLNSKTGHLEKTSILSVIMPPETIQSLNLESIDPSDSMQNFVHNMKFTKTGGFKGVDKVVLEK
ncbi:MAG: hypothetical protein NXH86_15715 [Flavobacteriaceae bacterium]|uniref:hypothetical protein n=1 Tax=Flagellimonas sp. SN16 TaxID=3415142 RepID=UPI003C39A850|nr:hypothetical protein [Flavobacteriaceae bacterium]